MNETNTLIVGAGFAGLASASSLGKMGVEYILIEKEAQIATPWRNHYDRLHLHTDKGLSSLPHKKFDNKIPRYPSRQQVVDYLDQYRKEFNINPAFYTEAISVRKAGDFWITETTRDTFKSKYLIIATGPYGKPKDVNFKGMETFPGKILHSRKYKTGRDFKELKVLVVGFGNSACEIAMDLYEQGAFPSMSVRSPVNVVPRDFLGIPIVRISLLFSKLPPRLADAITAPVIWLSFGNLGRVGFKKPPYGPFEQIKKEMKIPLLDIGTIRYIRNGHIRICDNIDRIEGKTVHFTDGKRDDFDAIIAAIGYYADCAEFLHIGKERFDDLKLSVSKQKFFGNDGLYFCGFWIGPTGEIRELSLDAQKIARDIAEKEIGNC
jgi:indole-3-pyruvate monooxygenase